MVKKRNKYTDEELSEKKRRIKREMDKYKYYDKKIKQLMLIEGNEDE